MSEPAAEPGFIWAYLGGSREGFRCDVCQSLSGGVWERLVLTPFRLRCWDHGPGRDEQPER